LRRTLSALTLLLLLPFIAAAQETTAPGTPATKETVTAPTASSHPKPKPRATIGVALEGGGALGLAHIGVLQWFEEHHIPVDYVAGTSMGGLVGGFYATGMSPEDLRKWIERIPWQDVLSDRTAYEDLSYRRKEDQRANPNSLILGLRKGLALPGGLNAGHQIGLLIDRETLPYYGVNSFDALPIPFRCVATDLVSGKLVVFKDGSLPEALRATMSIPGAFTPVYDKDKVLVDGGLLNNLPSDVAKEMGADIVIAVHLDTAQVEAQNIQSLFSVLQQSVRVVVAESEVRGMARADAVVSVGLAGYASTDYEKNGAIMQKGYEAAQSRAMLLEKFALSNADWQDYISAREARKKTLAPVPQFIQVQGTTTPAHKEDIARYLSAFAGKPLDAARLEHALTRLTGVGRYDTLGYRITEQDGKQGLLILVSEKNFAPPTIQPAFEVDGSEPGDVSFTMAARLTFMDVAGFRSEWRTEFQFGNTYGLASELYRPLSPESKWFIAPHANASDRALKIFQKGNPLADYRLDQGNIGADVGYGFSRFSELRIGYEVGYLDARLKLGTPEFPSVSGRTGAARLHYLMDHTDDPVIPRKGFRVETNFRWFDTSPGAKNGFPTLSTQAEYFQPVSQLGSIFLIGNGGTTFGNNNTGLPQFFLGGPLLLSAYGLNELRGDQYYLFQGGYLHDLFTLPPLLGKKIYAIGSYEAGKMYGAAGESKLPNDFAAGVLAETSLGPLFLGGSVGDSGHYKWFFQLGRVF
jgi:NTE family protein